MKISVCTISQNEQEDLPGFIEHLLDWVYEIVIVDDGSTDQTKQIALSYGNKIKFIEHPMGNDRHFGNQRNLSIEHASGDWLLHMDIDERVSDQLKVEILNSVNLEFDGFRYYRLNYFLNRPMKGGGFQSWNKCQLARKGKHNFVNKIHENCIIKDNTNVGQLNGFMYHLNDKSYNERIQKTIKYTHLEAEKLIMKGDKIFWYHIVFRPVKRFFKRFFLQKGYKDGVYGLIWAIHCFTAIFKVNILVWESQNKRLRKK